MSQTQLNPKVDAFLASETKWKDVFTELRFLITEFDLDEELKWGQPTYTLNGKNVLLVHGFKEYCAILFIKGALMNDPQGILIQQTENVQAGRQVRFKSLDQVLQLKESLKSYIQEAIDNEATGKEVEFKKPTEFVSAQELKAKFDAEPRFKAAFDALTPGRQRAYLLFFAAPKQASTRLSRIEKYTDLIMDGKGLND